MLNLNTDPDAWPYLLKAAIALTAFGLYLAGALRFQAWAAAKVKGRDFQDEALRRLRGLPPRPDSPEREAGWPEPRTPPKR